MTPAARVSSQALIAALALPDGCRVEQKIPKKLLLEHADATTADKRLINENIESIQWIAALKPNTVGVAAYRDALREYLEVAVLAVGLRSVEGKPVKTTRLAELVHRAIPYPLVLILDDEQRLILSLAHKRWAQNEAGKTVLDGEPVAVTLPDDAPTPRLQGQFMQTLTLGAQPRSNLLALYQGWVDTVHALLAARLTGTFTLAESADQAAARRQALKECEQLALEEARLRSLAAKEKQNARRVELNLALQRIRAQWQTARRDL